MVSIAAIYSTRSIVAMRAMVSAISTVSAEGTIAVMIYRSACRTCAWTTEIVVAMIACVWTVVSCIAMMMAEVTAIPTV